MGKRGGMTKDPAARQRSLAALVPGAGQVKPGEQRYLRSGGRSELLFRDVEAETRELMDALGEALPVKENGGVPPADVAALERAARALKRWRHLCAYNDLHGRLKEKTGAVKPSARYELEAEAALGRALDSLGLTPLARSHLGLNLVTAASAAERLDAHLKARYGNGAGGGE
jgi:hypothetical protein